MYSEMLQYVGIIAIGFFILLVASKVVESNDQIKEGFVDIGTIGS